MKFLLSILVIIGNLNVLLANNDNYNCRQNDLILLHLRSEFANLKIKLDEQINAIQAENKVLKEANENQETELKKLRQEFNNQSSEINTVKGKSILPIVGFNARLSSTPDTKTVNAGKKIVFDTVITNQGEGYHSSTGIFTAPFTGLYFFSAHVCNEGNEGVFYGIYQEGTQLTSSTQHYTSDKSCSSVSAIAMVNKADLVWVQCTYKSVFYSDTFKWNSFSGTLLNK